MVQFVTTPWRDRRELLAVRAQFYPNGAGAVEDDMEPAQQRRERWGAAVDRVSVWVHRGGCPHVAESTALIVAAVLADDDSSGVGGGLAARMAYATAFGR
jgi:ribosomal biogenesis protein LAS1